MPTSSDRGTGPGPTGLRLRHPDRRTHGRIATFAINGRPYPVPLFCPTCGTTHAVKTYHIAVDRDGVAYVSAEIWAVMQKYNEFAGFELASETRGKPPAQIIGLGADSAPVDVYKLEG